MAAPQKHSPHFLERNGPNGSVRLRMKFTAEEAAAFEEAAGATPVIDWLHQKLNEAARTEIEKVRAEKKFLPPPE